MYVPLNVGMLISIMQVIQVTVPFIPKVSVYYTGLKNIFLGPQEYKTLIFKR